MAGQENKEILQALKRIKDNQIFIAFLKKENARNTLKTYLENYQYDANVRAIDSLTNETEYIQSIIELLPDDQKEIIKERYYNGLTNKQIANKYNSSIVRVQDTLTKAYKFIKARYDPGEISKAAATPSYYLRKDNLMIYE